MVGARNNGCGRGNAIVLITLLVLITAPMHIAMAIPLEEPDAVTSWSTSTNTYFAAIESAKLLSYNGYIVNVGGYDPFNGVPYADARKAQVQSSGDIGTWSATTSIPVALGNHGSVIYNGYIYVVGGSTDGSVSFVNTVYYATIDSSANIGTWSTATNTLPIYWGIGELAACNGYLYTIGGISGITPTNAVYYSQIGAGGEPGVWTLTTALPQVRSRLHFDNLVYNGRVYVPGGYDNSAATATVYYASCGSGPITSWSTATNGLPETRMRHSATIDTDYGQLYVISGYTGPNLGGSYILTTRYGTINPSTGDIDSAWSNGPDLPAIRRYAGTAYTSSQKTVHVVCGGDASSNGYTSVYFGKTTTAFPPTVTVNAPNGGETLFAGASYPIQWTATNGTNPFGANPITIYYSTNNGVSWNFLTPGGVANSGSWAWLVNNTPTTDGLVKIVATDTVMLTGTDQSNNKFTIASTPAPMINLMAPAGGETWRGVKDITWQGASAGSSTVTYTISLSRDAGGTWAQVGSDQYKEGPTFVTHTHALDTKNYNDSDKARIKIEGADGTYTTIVTGNNFTIDNTPPQSKVDALPVYVNSTSFMVWWNGTDPSPGSGISNYTIYKAEGSGQMQVWLPDQPGNNGTLQNAVDGVMYKFQSIAKDKAGNMEQKSPSQPDAYTTVDLSPPLAKAEPLPKYSGLSMSIRFNHSENLSGLAKVWLYYRMDYTNWTLKVEYTSSPIQFTATCGGVYDFYVIGMDKAGNQDTKSQSPEASTTVDLVPPTILNFTTWKSLSNTVQVGTNISASDNFEVAEVFIEYRYSIDQQKWGPWSLAKNATGGGPQIKLPLKVDLKDGDGFYALSPGARDGAGNVVRGSERIVQLDTTPPTVKSFSPNGSNVPLNTEVKIEFLEPVDKPFMEKALKIVGLGDNVPQPSMGNFTWSDENDVISFPLQGLIGETTYVITISAVAKDIAGNKMIPCSFNFTTVPTTGDIVGTVFDDSGNKLSGVSIQVKVGKDTLSATSGPKGEFEFRGLPPGDYDITASIKGFDNFQGKVKVIAGKENAIKIKIGRAHV
jgi:hypothetical protein